MVRSVSFCIRALPMLTAAVTKRIVRAFGELEFPRWGSAFQPVRRLLLVVHTPVDLGLDFGTGAKMEMNLPRMDVRFLPSRCDLCGLAVSPRQRGTIRRNPWAVCHRGKSRMTALRRCG